MQTIHFAVAKWLFGHGVSVGDATLMILAWFGLFFSLSPSFLHFAPLESPNVIDIPTPAAIKQKAEICLLLLFLYVFVRDVEFCVEYCVLVKLS